MGRDDLNDVVTDLEDRDIEGSATEVVNCDDFVLLDKGELIFRGTREEIEESEIRFVRQFWRGESDG